MAAVKAKKPTTSKLKAGQKKKVNKWLIIGGVVAVAVIGALVVRFSSAAKWYSIKHVTGKWTMTTNGISATTYNTYEGKTYRVCFRGYTSKGTSKAVIYNIGTEKTTVSVGTSSAVYCSRSAKEYSSGKSNNLLFLDKTSGNNITVTAVSAEQLR